MSTVTPYPIGSPGQPWGEAERAQWLAQQHRQRSYADEVVAEIERLREVFEVVEYDQLDYAPDHYRLFALRSRDWNDDLPVPLVTGGVHGYETSGVPRTPNIGCGFSLNLTRAVSPIISFPLTGSKAASM